MATEAVEEQYRRVFRQLDSDGDGKITVAELRRCVEMTEEEAEEAVAGGGGGGLGEEEFVRMMMLAGEEEDEGERDKGLKEAFKMYSVTDEEEKDGRITPLSLKRMMSRLGDKRSVEECEAMISAFDLDGDGVLSFHEFKRMMS